MTTTATTCGMLGAYALGALDADEAAAVRRHLAECPECARRARRAARRCPACCRWPAAPRRRSTEPLSAAFEERLLDAYAREHRAPRRRGVAGWLPSRRRLRPRWLAVGAAAAVAAAAAVLGIVVLGDDEPAAAPPLRRRLPQHRRRRGQRPRQPRGRRRAARRCTCG